MQLLKEYYQQQEIRRLSTQEFELAEHIFATNLAYRPGESVAIVTDEKFWEKEASIWFEVAKKLPEVGAVKLFVLKGMKRSGENPPQEIVEACVAADISLLHTFYSLTHTTAKHALLKNGGRGFSLPGIDHAMMLRTLTTDYAPIQKLGALLKTSLENAQAITIKSKHGTNLTAGIRQNRVIADHGFATESNTFGNLPAGEVFFAPLDETTNGTWVVNGSMADVEEEVGSIAVNATQNPDPITIRIENGMAIEITGGKSAKILKKKLDAVGPDAYHVAEIGIGINPDANPLGKLIEAEKAYGTAHLALGNSKSFGGSVDVPIHLDGLTLEPEILLNGKIILESGKFSL